MKSTLAMERLKLATELKLVSLGMAAVNHKDKTTTTTTAAAAVVHVVVVVVALFVVAIVVVLVCHRHTVD